MTDTPRPGPTILAIFGAAGDLAWRKLIPALYGLHRAGRLPGKLAVIGLDAREMKEGELGRRLRQGVDRFGPKGKVKDDDWEAFSGHFRGYLSGDFTDIGVYKKLASEVEKIRKDWDVEADAVFYLATPPFLMQPIAERLGQVGLADDRDSSRIVVEKPFGHDLESARTLNRALSGIFAERQIYRIDHYLGKETVQNILAFRFANALFEPVWDQRYIDHVQITVAEQVGVEHRGGYYDKAGALRDMVQNHLFQILCLVAMEPPVSFGADEVRGKKVEVLRALRPIREAEVHDLTVRGQYGRGWIEGDEVPAYHEEPDVDPESSTETYAALKLQVDNWRWHGVPFYLRTGKRLPSKVSEVFIQFKPVPHQAFPASSLEDWQPNRLSLHIQPDEGIHFRIQAKRPGLDLRLSPVDLHFRYSEAFDVEAPTAYETLLQDVMDGDATLFMRSDQVEEAWSFLAPVLEVWGGVKPVDFPNYASGTWGPETAEHLISRDGRSWLLPTAIAERKDALREG